MNPYREVDPNRCAPPQPKQESQWRLGAIFDERRGEFQTYYKLDSWFKRAGESDEHVKERGESARKLDIATEFMNVQLQEFEGDPSENSYTTWRHEGHRLGADRKPEKEVHVYEMYWADLARPNNSLLRFLFRFTNCCCISSASEGSRWITHRLKTWGSSIGFSLFVPTHTLRAYFLSQRSPCWCSFTVSRLRRCLY